MSPYPFEKTIVFVAFAGELGLVGSTLAAAKAKSEHAEIEGVPRHDIVGVAAGGDGHTENGFVHVFSAGPEDSPSPELARYVREAGQGYVPSFRAESVFREDRFSRSGDHKSLRREWICTRLQSRA